MGCQHLQVGMVSSSTEYIKMGRGQSSKGGFITEFIALEGGLPHSGGGGMSQIGRDL